MESVGIAGNTRAMEMDKQTSVAISRPIRLMLIWPLFKSYFVFLVLVAVFNAYQFGGYTLFVSYGVFLLTFPIVVTLVLLTALFPRHFYAWHRVYCVGVPAVMAPLIGWVLWDQNAPILSTVLIAVLTLPTTSIFFVHQEQVLLGR